MRGKRKGLLLLLLLCLFTGCNKTPVEEKPQETPAPTPEPLVEYDWKTQEWKSFEEATESTPMHIREYIPLEWAVPEFEHTFLRESYDNFGGDLYLLQTYNTEGGVRYFLNKLNGDTGELSVMELNGEECGFTHGFVDNMQVISEEEIIFFAVDTEDTKVVDCLAIHMSMEGKLLYETSLYSFYEEHELLEESSLGIMLPQAPIFDAFGNAYYHDLKASEIFMIDKDGKETLILDYSNDRKINVLGDSLLPDGSVAFALSDFNEWMGKLLWLDGKSTTPVTLGTMSKAYFDNALVTEHGYVYYVSGDILYRWNIRVGVCEKIFSFSDNGISGLQWIKLDVNSDGELLLYQYDGDEKAAYVLSPGEMASEEKTVTIAGLAFKNNYLEGCAASYSRKNPGTLVKYENMFNDADRTRILAEIAKGGGPDMLWVSAEDMRLLQEKGALCGLEELVAKDTLDSIFDGVIASGMVNGELVGLVSDAYPESAFTSNSTWTESGWNVLDILGIMENKDLEGLFTDSGGNGYSGKSMLYYLVCYDMTDSPFIDLEKGESRFDRKEFIKILELTEGYAKKGAVGGVGKVQDGTFLAKCAYLSGISAFCMEMSEMGEGCHLIGMPSENKYVGNWVCPNFLVVNKNSPYKKEIAGYLEELLSLRNQRRVNTNSIRRDVIEECMLVPDWDSRPHYKTGPGTYIILEAKPDGTPYFEEYMDFLENCGPTPFRVEAISDIILQEAELFYNGVQNAAKTADNIDSRVQLYLDELK